MDKVELIYRFENTADEIWCAWTDPKLIMQWFGSDPNGKVDEVNIDVKTGGQYSVSFHDSNGTKHTCFGAYESVAINQFLSFTWEWKSEPGHITHISIVITPNRSSTEMRFIHSDLGTESAHQYEEGWQSTFEKLKIVLHQLRSTRH